MRDTIVVAPTQPLRVRSKYRNFSDYIQGHGKDEAGSSGDEGVVRSCSTTSVDSNTSTMTNPAPYSSYREYLDSYGKKSFKSVTPPVEGRKTATVKSEIYIPINADTTDCRPFREVNMVVKPEVAQKPHLPPPPPKMPEDLTTVKNSVIDEIRQAVRSGNSKPSRQQYVPQNSYQITRSFAQPSKVEVDHRPNQINKGFAQQNKFEVDPITRITSQNVVDQINNSFAQQTKLEADPITRLNSNTVDQINRSFTHQTKHEADPFTRVPVDHNNKNFATKLANLEVSINTVDQPNKSFTQQTKHEADPFTRVPVDHNNKNFTTKLSNLEADPITRVPVTSPNSNSVDKNDPNINKLVYDTYRGLLKAYNKPANNFVSTLPRNMVVQDRGVTEQLNNIASAPPPPPLGPGNSIPAVRLKSEVADRRPEPPLCVQNAMMTKDKKPFTYTPGGIDLSEIKSPRMVRRLEHNANAPGVGEMPRSPQGYPAGPLPPSALAAMQPALPVQVFPVGPPAGPAPPPPPPPPPTQPLPTKPVATNEGVFERPDMTKIIPENPMALLKKTPRVERRSFLDELNTQDPSILATNGTAKQPSSSPQQQMGYTPQPQAYTPQPQAPVAYSPQPQAKPFSPQPPQADYGQPQSYTPQPPSPQYSPAPQQQAKPFSPQPAQYSPQAGYGKPQSYTPQPPSPQYSPQAVSSPQPQAKPFSPQPQYSPQVQPQYAPQPQYRPQPQQQPPSPPHKGNSNVGSLYIPPINQVQAQPCVETPPPTPPQRQPQSPQTPQSPIPKLNAAPKPWQNQKKEPEIPPWAQRPQDDVGYFQPPPRVTPVQMQPPPPRPGVEVVWVTQPEVYQHPGPAPPNQRWVPRQPPPQQQHQPPPQQYQPPPQQHQPPQNQAQQQPHTRIIPIQIEGGAPQQVAAPGTPSNDRSMNRQQSWTPNQSNSFKILQKMTSTDGDGDGQSNGQSVVEHGPRTAQQFYQPPPNDQFRKMNVNENDRDFMNRVKQDSSYDEENPRYRGGLIPSRVFRMLDESGVDIDPRYMGASMPSKAFRLLQTMTDNHTIPSVPPARSPQVRTIPVQLEGEEPSQPYVHPSQQTVPEPKKYMGGAIPSRAFKMVQAMTGGQQLAENNQINEPSSYEQWGYDYPPPPYWQDYYPYYYPHRYPGPYPAGEAGYTSEGEDKRGTPVPYWGYYYPSDSESEADYHYGPYWDPYYYNYYYGYPQMYYYPSDYDGYSSTDEMALYAKEPEPAQEAPVEDEGSDHTIVEEDDSSDSSEEGESIYLSTQSVPCLEDDDATEKTDECSSEYMDDDAIPHVLSVIYEESERGSRLERHSRESSVASETTVVMEDDDTDYDSEQEVVSVKLPLKLKFSITNGNQEVTEVTVGNSEVNSFAWGEDVATEFTLPSPSRSRDRFVDDQVEVVAVLPTPRSAESKPDDIATSVTLQLASKEDEEEIDFWSQINKDEDVLPPRNKVVSYHSKNCSTESEDKLEKIVATEESGCSSSEIKTLPDGVCVDTVIDKEKQQITVVTDEVGDKYNEVVNLHEHKTVSNYQSGATVGSEVTKEVEHEVTTSVKRGDMESTVDVINQVQEKLNSYVKAEEGEDKVHVEDYHISNLVFSREEHKETLRPPKFDFAFDECFRKIQDNLKVALGEHAPLKEVQVSSGGAMVQVETVEVTSTTLSGSEVDLSKQAKGGVAKLLRRGSCDVQRGQNLVRRGSCDVQVGGCALNGIKNKHENLLGRINSGIKSSDKGCRKDFKLGDGTLTCKKGSASTTETVCEPQVSDSEGAHIINKPQVLSFEEAPHHLKETETINSCISNTVQDSGNDGVQGLYVPNNGLSSSFVDAGNELTETEKKESSKSIKVQGALGALPIGVESALRVEGVAKNADNLKTTNKKEVYRPFTPQNVDNVLRTSGAQARRSSLGVAETVQNPKAQSDTSVEGRPHCQGALVKLSVGVNSDLRAEGAAKNADDLNTTCKIEGYRPFTPQNFDSVLKSSGAQGRRSSLGVVETVQDLKVSGSGEVRPHCRLRRPSSFGPGDLKKAGKIPERLKGASGNIKDLSCDEDNRDALAVAAQNVEAVLGDIESTGCTSNLLSRRSSFGATPKGSDSMEESQNCSDLDSRLKGIESSDDKDTPAKLADMDTTYLKNKENRTAEVEAVVDSQPIGTITGKSTPSYLTDKDRLTDAPSNESKSRKTKKSRRLSEDDLIDQEVCDLNNNTTSKQDFYVPSIKERIRALHNASKNSGKKKKKPVQEIEVVAPEPLEDRTPKSRHSTKSLKSLEDNSEDDIDSGVTDMSKHISDNESEFTELNKLSKYQRAATHSRLFKLLQEECEGDDEDNPKTNQLEEFNNQMRNRKEQLSLPVKGPFSDYESFSSSCMTSPQSPITDRLVNEVVLSLLKKKKGKVLRGIPLERLQAAAYRILQEDLAHVADCPESATAVQTPQEFYTNSDYCETFDDYDIVPSKTLRMVQGAGPGFAAKCPRVVSSKKLHDDLTQYLSPSPEPQEAAS